MNRDMELIRKILLEISEIPSAAPIFNLKINGYDMETVAGHCKLLDEHGLVDGYKSQGAANSLYSFTVGHLTWEGCDYLEKIRDENAWKKVKRQIKEKCLPFTIEVIKEIAISLLKEGS